MKKLRILAIAIMLGVLGIVSSVSAQTITADPGGTVEEDTHLANLSIDGTLWEKPNQLVGRFPIQIGSQPIVGAFCVDPRASIGAGLLGDATIDALDASQLVLDIMRIISQNNAAIDGYLGSPLTNLPAAGVQAAIWQMIYETSPVELLYFDKLIRVLVAEESPNNPGIIENEAANLRNELVSSGFDSFTVDFHVTSDPQIIDVVVSVQAFETVEEVTLSITQGTFLANGEQTYTWTSTGVHGGTFSVQVDLGGTDSIVEVEAVATGTGLQQLCYISPIAASGEDGYFQNLVFIRPGDWAVRSFFDTRLISPRTIGFWKHQVKLYLAGKTKGAQLTPQQLEAAMLAILPLIEPYTPDTPPVPVAPDPNDPVAYQTYLMAVAEYLSDMLWIKKAPMKDRALQQFIATCLNFTSGELFDYSLVDIDYDGVWDVTFEEALILFDIAWNEGDEGNGFEIAKNICDSINNMNH